MSLETEITRVIGGTKDTLKALITKLGGTVGNELIDQYSDLAGAATKPDKWDKGVLLDGGALKDVNGKDVHADVKAALDIPSANDAKLTIQKNGTEIGTFSANASAGKTINITVPTKASDIGAASSAELKKMSAALDEVNAIPKPNLFINPLFQIWQLYPSGWSGVPVNRYVCDGWRVLSSDGNKQNNLRPASPYGMTNAAGGASCTISQFLENAAQFNGLLLTCSVLKITTGGSQSFVTATKTASGWTDSTDILAFFGTSSAWRWIGPGETLIGAKLEIGAQQTFVHKQANGTYVLNSVPTVAEQLAICNKYDPETGKLLGGWDHPPMERGVEYRTTERYLGKPVYTKLVDCGTIPAQGTHKDLVFSPDVACIVSVSAYSSMRGNTFPYYDANGVKYSIAGSGNAVMIWNYSESLLDTNVCALIKYTKTTD